MSDNALARPADRMREATKQISLAIKGREAVLRDLLPPEISPARMRSLALTIFQKNPALLDCSIPSILGAIYEAAKVGLEPDTGTQDCHLIPYKGKATFQLGFRGLVKLARRGMGSDVPIWSGHVCAGDHFVHEENPPSLEHRRRATFKKNGAHEWMVPMTPEERGPLIAAYACARFKDGFVLPRVVYEDEIARARKSSKSRNGPWIHHEPAMWEKTAVKRLCKLLPMPDYVGRVIALDDEADDSRDQKLDDSWNDLPEGAIVDAESTERPADACPICNNKDGQHEPGCPDRDPETPSSN